MAHSLRVAARSGAATTRGGRGRTGWRSGVGGSHGGDSESRAGGRARVRQMEEEEEEQENERVRAKQGNGEVYSERQPVEKMVGGRREAEGGE